MPVLSIASSHVNVRLVEDNLNNCNCVTFGAVVSETPAPLAELEAAAIASLPAEDD